MEARLDLARARDEDVVAELEGILASVRRLEKQARLQWELVRLLEEQARVREDDARTLEMKLVSTATTPYCEYSPSVFSHFSHVQFFIQTRTVLGFGYRP